MGCTSKDFCVIEIRFLWSCDLLTAKLLNADIWRLLLYVSIIKHPKVTMMQWVSSKRAQRHRYA